MQRLFSASLARSSRIAVPVGYSLAGPARSPLRPAFNPARFYSEKKSEQEEPNLETIQEELKEEQKLLDELKATKEQLEAKEKEAADLKDKFLRTVADYRNLQEVTKREISKAKDFALSKFAKDLLGSIDNFELALKSIDHEKLSSEKSEDALSNKEFLQLFEGIKMTKNIFEKTLASHGVEKIHPEDGEKFDPNVHEATFEMPHAEKEPGTVFFVQQPGYSLNKRVLRPAKVGVVKSSE